MGWDGHVGMILMMSVWAGRHLQWQNSKTDQLETSVTLWLREAIVASFFNFLQWEGERERQRQKEFPVQFCEVAVAGVMLRVGCDLPCHAATCCAMLPPCVLWVSRLYSWDFDTRHFQPTKCNCPTLWAFSSPRDYWQLEKTRQLLQKVD